MALIRKSKAGDAGQESSLAKEEKIYAWLLSFCNAIVTAIIFYFGWKKAFPKKSKEAMQIAAWAFLIELAVGTALILSGVIKIPFPK